VCYYEIKNKRKENIRMKKIKYNVKNYFVKKLINRKMNKLEMEINRSVKSNNIKNCDGYRNYIDELSLHNGPYLLNNLKIYK